MKSRTLSIFGSALVILSALFFVLDICLAEEEASDFVSHLVAVSKLSGGVEVLAKDATVWEAAEPGMQLNEGDKIRTAEDAKAQLTFPDESFINLKEDTILAIQVAREEISTKATEYNLDFRVGEIMVELKKLKKGSSFKVETPTAVAAIRGTTFYMRTGTEVVDGVQQPFTDLYVDSDDIINFTNTVSNEMRDVHQHEGSSSYGDGTVEEPEVLAPSAQDTWKKGWDIEVDADSDKSSKEEKKEKKEKGSKKSMRDTDEEKEAKDKAKKEEEEEDEGLKKGMRDVDEEEGEEVISDADVGKDVEDTVQTQDQTQEDANEDQTEEQDVTGLEKEDAVTDSDGDGVVDANDLYPSDSNRASGDDLDSDGIDDEFDSDIDGDGCANASDEFPRDYWEHVDTDSDTIGDFEDAFSRDSTIHPDTVYAKGYGSRNELRQAAIDNLLTIQSLRSDIYDMIDDIQARQFEAVKEKIFDHQVAKVMTDRWGNRVRVEEYVCKPTNDQVQILALNLRTSGPNAGISSLDFRVTFDEDISNTNLKTLPWDDYMHNPQVGEFEGEIPGDDYKQLILYYQDNPGYYNPKGSSYNYPIPLEFSIEVKNPYGNSVKASECYSELLSEEIDEGEDTVWYQIEEGNNMYINGILKTYDTEENDFQDEWGDGWNQANRFTFIDYYEDGSWLLGAFYLINDDGSLVSIEEEREQDRDYLEDIRGIRDCINPDFNLEMVFLSSEFPGTDPDLPENIEDPDDAYERELYNNNRTIDVITIPELTTPYKDFEDLGSKESTNGGE